MEQVETFLKLDNKKDQEDYYWKEVICQNLIKEFHQNIKIFMSRKDRKEKRYYYLITFTLSDEHKDDDPKTVRKYIIKRLAGKALQIEKAHIVEELTQQGRPHWHASIIAKKYISKDRFKYYENKYGFIDISKNHSKNYDTMLKYISKSAEPTVIMGGVSS